MTVTDVGASLIYQNNKLWEENERLRAALGAARDTVAYYQIEFSRPNFTDRYDDAGRCARLLKQIDAALSQPEAEPKEER